MSTMRRYVMRPTCSSRSSGSARGGRAKRRDLEGPHGRALVQWADLSAPTQPALAFLLHIPNGGARSARVGAELKRQGVRRGVWDYLLPMARPPVFPAVAGYAGLWIELKEPGERGTARGGLSKHQVAFGRFVQAHGYAAVVAYDWTEARDALLAYLDTGAVPLFFVP